MTDSTKSVTRVSVLEHPRHGRKIVVTIGPGDTVSLRLAHAKKGDAAYIPLSTLYDIAERKRAESVAGFSAAPCADPKKPRKL